LQHNHGLNIKNFEGDENDLELFELTEDLKNIVRMEVDVRDALPKVREKMLARYNQLTQIIEVHENNENNDNDCNEADFSFKPKDVSII
jgi:hypothetical protein